MKTKEKVCVIESRKALNKAEKAEVLGMLNAGIIEVLANADASMTTCVVNVASRSIALANCTFLESFLDEFKVIDSKLYNCAIRMCRTMGCSILANGKVKSLPLALNINDVKGRTLSTFKAVTTSQKREEKTSNQKLLDYTAKNPELSGWNGLIAYALEHTLDPIKLLENAKAMESIK